MNPRYRSRVGAPPQLAADAVAHHGLPQLGADGNAQAGLALPVFLAVDHHSGLHAGLSLSVNAPEHMILFYGHGSFHGFSFAGDAS